MKKLIFVLSILLLTLTIPTLIHTTTHPAASHKASTPFPGGTAPDFTLNDYQGHPHQLSALHGKPILLNFWASWCGPCQMEMPELARASKTFGDKLQFLGVNLAERDSTAVSKALLQKNNIGYPNVLDDQGQIADRYQILVIPTTVLLDSNGKIIARIQGPVTSAQIADLLRKLY